MKQITTGLRGLIHTLVAIALILIAGGRLFAQEMLTPFADGAWSFATYSGHSAAGTFGAVDFNYGTGEQDFGKEIRAPHDGILLRKVQKDLQGKFAGYGQYVEIERAGKAGEKSLMAHLSRYNDEFPDGSFVFAGDVIGYCGKTGNATASHLHFQYFVNGVIQDVRKITFDGQKLQFGSNLSGKSLITALPLLKEGKMYRESSHGEVYWYIAGAKWWISTESDVDYFGGWNAINVVRDGKLSDLPLARPRENTLFRQRSFAPVFVALQGSFWWIQTENAVSRYGGWDKVVIVPDYSFDFGSSSGNIW
jgi:hypothetical protein